MQKGRPSSDLFLSKHGVHGRSLQKAAAELHTCITVYNWAGLLKKLWILRKNKGRKPSQQPQLTAPNSPKSPQRSGCTTDTRAAAVYRRDSPALSRFVPQQGHLLGDLLLWGVPAPAHSHPYPKGWELQFQSVTEHSSCSHPCTWRCTMMLSQTMLSKNFNLQCTGFFSSYPALQLQWQLFLGSPGQHPLCFPKILLKVDKKNLSLISDGKKNKQNKKNWFLNRTLSKQ